MRLRLALAGLASAWALGAHAQPKLLDWPDLMARPLPKATARIAYGPDPLQVAEVWRPDGKGPFPTVLMIHGGCWRSGLANLHIMDYAAEDLRRRGIGVWNIEYRGVDRPGGGYPGTFQDVNAAADALLAHGREYGLDASKLVVLGHSAGGHLAIWLAARAKVPPRSPLHDATPLPLLTVISLGGLPDLATAAQGCGDKAVAKMAGEPGPGRPDVYSDTSPSVLLPLGVPQLLVNAEHDDVAPPPVGQAFAARARASGDVATAHTVEGEGHVEEIAPGSKTWTGTAAFIDGMIKERWRDLPR